MKAATLHSFFRFSAVGIAGLLVDTAVLYASAHLLGWYGARVLSFLVAATATYGLNRRFTFTTHSSLRPAMLLGQYLRYLRAMTLGGLVNYLVYAAVVALLKVPAAPLMGVALGSCAGLLFNFMSARHLFLAAGKSRTPR